MKNLKMLSIPLFAVVLIVVALIGKQDVGRSISTPESRRGEVAQSLVEEVASTTFTVADGQILQAYQNRQSNLQMQGGGKVNRILPDDNKGSRHQKFILSLSNGMTLLIAHNIDLAPRINSLQVGEVVEFYGEYEWNEKGGVVHWTHHDPGGRHIGGWLKHDGRTYQ